MAAEERLPSLPELRRVLRRADPGRAPEPRDALPGDRLPGLRRLRVGVTGSIPETAVSAARPATRPRAVRGRFVAETFAVRCRCGEPVRLLSRGRIYLLPSGHACPLRRTQEDVLRTLALEEAAGARTTEAEVDRRLRLWGLGGDLLWRYSNEGKESEDAQTESD